MLMETKFNLKSQICTSRSQSERLLALGLKKETADMVHSTIVVLDNLVDLISEHPWTARQEVTDNWYPAWSLHRLIEILDTNPFVFYTNCGYDTVIDHVEEYIRSGFIDTRYLEEWCLNEEEL